MWCNVVAAEKLYRIWWLGSVFLMMLIVHATNSQIEPWLESFLTLVMEDKRVEQRLLRDFFNVYDVSQYKSTLMLHMINPLKSLLFAIGLFIVSWPILKESHAYLRHNTYLIHQQKSCFVTAVAALGVLLILITPINGITLTGYLQMSLDPYIETAWHNIEYKRFLLPFVARLFQLQGELLYFLLHITLIFISFVLIQYWLLLNEIKLRFYQFVSLLTSSFIAHQFQVVGNPEVLVFICWLLCITIPFSDLTKLSLLIMALLTHEASMFISPLLALFIFQKKTSHSCAFGSHFDLSWPLDHRVWLRYRSRNVIA